MPIFDMMKIPRGVQLSSPFKPVILSKRSWEVSFSYSAMGNKLVFHPSPIHRAVTVSRKPPVARALCFDSVIEDCPMDDAVLSDVEMNAFGFSAAPVSRPVHARQSKPVIVESEVRRSARLSALRDGFRHSSLAMPASLKKP